MCAPQSQGLEDLVDVMCVFIRHKVTGLRDAFLWGHPKITVYFSRVL